MIQREMTGRRVPDNLVTLNLRPLYMRIRGQKVSKRETGVCEGTRTFYHRIDSICSGEKISTASPRDFAWKFEHTVVLHIQRRWRIVIAYPGTIIQESAKRTSKIDSKLPRASEANKLSETSFRARPARAGGEGRSRRAPFALQRTSAHRMLLTSLPTLSTLR